MSVNTQSGMVTTTMGLRKRRPPVCAKCKERRDTTYTSDEQGGYICAYCAKEQDRDLLVPSEEAVDYVPKRERG